MDLLAKPPSPVLYSAASPWDGPEMSLLSLRNIHFTYGGPPLLEGIDLEIKRVILV